MASDSMSHFPTLSLHCDLSQRIMGIFPFKPRVSLFPDFSIYRYSRYALATGWQDGEDDDDDEKVTMKRNVALWEGVALIAGTPLVQRLI